MEKPPIITPKLIPVPHAADAYQAAQFYKELESDVLARTLWGEARGEGKQGMEAVAAVIINRTEIAKKLHGYWWGNTIIQVCQKPFQFSCWNKSDPNFQKLTGLTEENDIFFATALRVARRTLLGFVKDPTYGATHYHARNIMPHWAKGQKPSAVIGRHIFYHLTEV